MNYTALIENRKSVREFRTKAVPADLVEAIRSYHDKGCMRLDDTIATRLVVLDTRSREALEGSAGYEDYLIGAPCYLVLLSERKDRAYENGGYMMEDMILKLNDLGLDACWITFHREEEVRAALGLGDDMEIAAVAAFGYGQKTARRLRLNIRNMTKVDVVARRGYFSPKKDISQLAFLNEVGNTQGLDEHIGFYEDMLWQALYAVSLTPSYLNRQSYCFVLKGQDVILVSLPDPYTDEVSQKLNLGIAMLHFGAAAEQWVGRIRWDLADAPALALPEGASVSAVYHM